METELFFFDVWRWTCNIILKIFNIETCLTRFLPDFHTKTEKGSRKKRQRVPTLDQLKIV